MLAVLREIPRSAQDKLQNCWLGECWRGGRIEVGEIMGRLNGWWEMMGGSRRMAELILFVGLLVGVWGCAGATLPPAPLQTPGEGGKVTRIPGTISPTNTLWPTATFKSTETSTPTIPAMPFFQANEVDINRSGLYWLECEVSWDIYHNWGIAEDCFGKSLLSFQDENMEIWGERFQRAPMEFDDIRLAVGNDIYETKHQRGSPYRYTLIKNGTVFAKANSRFGTYDPNRSLINIDGKVAWELADYEYPSIIFDGQDLKQRYKLDAAYYPYNINDKLIFIAKMDGKYTVYFNGEHVGPAFDEISIGYCCGPAAYSIQRAQGQYRFWGSREGRFYLVTVQTLDRGD